MLAAVVWCTPASAEVLLDQRYIPPRTPIIVEFMDGRLCAQTFTVATTGLLDHVELLLQPKINGSGKMNLTVEIHDTVDGKPVYGATPLASTSLTTTLPPNTRTFVPVDFSAFNLPVTKDVRSGRHFA